MADALGLLPSDQRTLLWLREAEGQSYGELVVILELEIPICTVRSRLFAAREALGLSGAFV
jgi:RNA polymerase sigma-70 factor (ECF subfamily)